MKIILCTFLLCITTVSVFGQSVPLNGILGESVKFSAAVEEGGYLMYRGVIIGDSSLEPPGVGKEKNSGRVQWDSSTGFFSLSGLKMEDIGEYKVQNTDPNINTVFQLHVRVPVSKPHVRVTRNEYRCTILCTVENGTRATLSWYREGEKESYSSSPVESAPHLYLPLPVERSGTYTCEANNSVSNKKASITVGAHCTVSVFVELNGILGESVKFPAAVKKGGFLMYSGVIIGDSSLGASRNVNYRDRLQWDSSTGFFSLSGLKMEDSGEYKVQNTDQNITRIFQLNVYKDNVPVSKPHVSITQNEYPCTIECTAERGTGATLSWYREGEKKSLVSSRVASAPHLYLPESVERSGTYTCEAKNSVSNETASITVGAHCTAPTSSSTGIIVAIIIAAVVVLIAVVFAVLLHRFIRRRRAVRTLIQVKKLFDNVDPHEYAVRPFILVKELLDNVDLHAFGIRRGIPAVRGLFHVKKLFDNVDPHEYDETVSPDAVRTFIQVKKILDNVDPHICGNRSKDAIIDDIIRIYQGGCIYDPVRNTITTTTIHEKMTSSHQDP